MPAYPVKQIYNIIDKLELDIDIIFVGIDISILDKNNIPEHTGVYILVDEFGRRYIGSSVSIFNRQYNHHIVENIKTIDVYLTEDISVAKELESILIFVLDPELNRFGKCQYFHKILDENARIDYVRKTFEYRKYLTDYRNPAKRSTYDEIKKIEGKKLRDLEHNKIEDKQDINIVKKSSYSGDAVYLELRGLIEKNRYYSIKKIGNKIIIEDIYER